MAEMETDRETEALRQSILAHDKEFQELMCMIPAKYYIPPQQQQLPSSTSNGQKTSKKARQKQEKAAAEAKRLQKRAKYDPDTLPTVPVLQGLNKCSEPKPALPTREQKSSDDSDEEDDEDDESLQLACPRAQLSQAELQQKLQQRIGKLQGASNRQLENANGEPMSTNGELATTSKDALLAIGRQKRGEMRDRRRRERKEARRKEKLLKQEQLLLAKQKKGSLPAKPRTGNFNKGTEAHAELKVADEALVVEPTGPPKNPQAESSKPKLKQPAPKPADSSHPASSDPPIQEPDLAYSALSFEVKTSGVDAKVSRGQKNPSWTSKNPQEAKIASERRQAYLEKLTPQARERAEENKKWEKAQLQASGTKVMDDPKKIEKALKRQTKDKRKRRDAWDERTKMVEKAQEDRQKKRRENIEKRKEQIHDKRKGVKAKGNSKSKTPKKSVKGF